MATERPVTGSCERCAWAYDLLIPEPGSGDLDLQRIGARFSWCAGCDRTVGRTCCWDGSAALCPDCASVRATSDPSMTDAVLTRTALSGLSAATETMDGLERALLRLRVNDEEEGRSAWEDAWLETGIAIVRADSAVRTARSRGDESSLAPDDARWMRQQLAALGDRWEERYRAVADRLERVGLRLHALGTLALPAASPADPPPDRQRETIPAAAPVDPVPAPSHVSVGATTPATDGAAELQGTPDAVSPPPAPPSERPTATVPNPPAATDPTAAEDPAEEVIAVAESDSAPSAAPAEEPATTPTEPPTADPLPEMPQVAVSDAAPSAPATEQPTAIPAEPLAADPATDAPQRVAASAAPPEAPADAQPATASAALLVGAQAERVPVPVGNTLSPVTRLPIREAAQNGDRPPAPADQPPAPPVAVASWPPSRDGSAATLDLPPRAAAGSYRGLPVRPPAPPRVVRPASPPAWEGRPVLARSESPRRLAAPRARERTVGSQVVTVLLALLTFIGLVVTAAMAFEIFG